MVLAEGDPESLARSGSGTPRSLLDALRRRGTDAVSASVEPAALGRVFLAANTFSADRERWRARFHQSASAFRRRSQLAAEAVRRLTPFAVLQYGATFAAHVPEGIGSFVYSDNNILNSVRQANSQARRLSDSELAAASRNEAEVYAAADKVFCFSDFVRRSMVADFNLPEDKLVVVGAGPNLPPDLLPTPEAVAARRPPEDPTVLFIGRDFHQKGGETLYRAFSQVRASIPNARLLVIGPPAAPHAPGVEALGFVSKDTAHGMSRLRQALQASTVFCLPTRYESFGISIVEAMHFGLPVVATDGWAIPEIVEDGKTGFLVPLDDATAVAASLTSLLTNPGLARGFGMRGFARARARYSWSAVADTMLQHILAH